MRYIDNLSLANLYKEAEKSERLRAHLLLHQSHKDKVQRLLIALVKGSYVEPHYHELPHQWEMFVILEGTIEVALYDHMGEIIESFLAGENTDTSIVNLEPNEVHSIKCLSEKALMLEVKEGPFDANYAKKFLN
ncbi:WbuC family cupin fold metalloprotein [Proteus mirabilis]|uniref:WbuC n=1 Tax=Proteus mirabilis TaxID=584 RepID=A0A385JM09_PROMI|nr:WbuC family cupin fold metalloprotein [Proteus mirabilis]MBA7798044.1 WbuC family cupin fold metalloprotein [Citrobacter sp. RHBSTW-01065]AXY99374.1 wbuC [Proteus mirabilis]EJD6537249.1 WbuC family cupin fold metalloprotein [Proteus mirabilis]EKV1612462.1 WbuC family cupin fold metalloprotein [Proteus mirabilis]EKX5075136.1 WbuC family cupin fold metalloprotein [Proteus mirabilis]